MMKEPSQSGMRNQTMLFGRRGEPAALEDNRLLRVRLSSLRWF
jgi:hypothetical protein